MCKPPCHSHCALVVPESQLKACTFHLIAAGIAPNDEEVEDVMTKVGIK